MTWALALGAAGVLATSPSAAVARATGCPDTTAYATADAANLSPAFSPDGRRIVFQRMVGDADRIFVARTEGTRVRQVTRGPDDWFPAWSPRGGWIAFDRDTSSERTEVERRNVYVVRPDGTGLRRLTSGWNLAPARAAPRRPETARRTGRRTGGGSRSSARPATRAPTSS